LSIAGRWEKYSPKRNGFIGDRKWRKFTDDASGKIFGDIILHYPSLAVEKNIVPRKKNIIE
jgi:hypothetical protein